MSRFRELEQAVMARKGRRSGDEIWFRCPFPDNHKNGDARPSAKFNVEKGVWYCTVCKQGSRDRDLAGLLGVDQSAYRQIAAAYPYTDEDGQVLFEVVRFANPKDFRQRRPDGSGGWIWNTKGVRRVLYRLPELLAAVQAGRTVYVVEGEKDADNLARLGLAATTSPGGAGKWKQGYSRALHGARVAILPDNDPPGRDHAQRVAVRLDGIAAEVRVVPLPDLPDGGDVSDWISALCGSKSADDDIRERLGGLIAEAPLWQPGGEDVGDASSLPPRAQRASDAVGALWALGSDPDPAVVADALQPIVATLAGADSLTIQTARALAMRALRHKKLPAPAKMVDAALAGVGTQARRSSRPTETASDPRYQTTETGLVYLKSTKEGKIPLPLTNFTAKIVTEIARDDGAEVRRSFEIKAHHRGRVHRFEVSAARFSGMGWVTEQLGATAVVNAGLGTRDHTRVAIQVLSDEVQTRTLYAHLGWRRIADQWCYLHAAGAIGPNGTVPEIETDLPRQLQLYHLPAPVGEDELVRAIRASLRIVDLLPDPVTVPVYGAIWRAVLGPSDHSVHLVGPTGEGKSELGARGQQHFGPGLDARHLPGSWTSTANSLEVIAFLAKDTLLTVDDFAPEGTPFDVQRQHREAARLFRAQGNNAGRDRLRPDGGLRPPRMPRGLILSTGEEVPGGQSVRARNFILEVPAGGMDWDLLGRCQADGAAGLYAQAMTGFLIWVANRYGEVTELRPRRLQELRSLATASGQHRRTPGIVADLAFGLETFLRFAVDVGARSETEALALRERWWAALGEAAAAQVEHVASADPTRRFLELLTSAIASGRAYVASEKGTAPEAAAAWGWRERTIGTGEYCRQEWQPLGNQVGWLSDGQLYLEPDAAYKAAQGAATLDGLSVQSRTLWKRLREKGLLVRTDETRKRNVVRVTLQGKRREVLHLRPETLLPAETAQTAQTAQEPGELPLSGPISWDARDADGAETSQQTVPDTPVCTGGNSSAGPIGTIGPFSEATDLDGWEDP